MKLEEEEPYFSCCVCTMPYPRLYPCTLPPTHRLPTAPVSKSFGFRSSYEIDIFDTDHPGIISDDVWLRFSPSAGHLTERERDTTRVFTADQLE